MTRRGAHKHHYPWVGHGGINVYHQRLKLYRDYLKKLEGNLSEWARAQDYLAMRAAFEVVTAIHRSASVSRSEAQKHQPARASFPSHKLVNIALRTQSKLRSMLQNAPSAKSGALKPKLRPGGLSQRKHLKPERRSRAEKS